jgi:cytochrome c oxidase subunit 4
MKHEIVPIRTYILVWAALIVLTFTTAGVAEIDLGEFNIVVAITIAVIKMLLVVTIFMHVKQADNLTRLFVAAGFFWFLILIVFFSSDYISRGWLPVGKPW